MAEQIETSSWGNTLSLRIAARLRALREDLGLSAQQLSDDTKTLGHPISRQVIANIESGRRATIGVADLFVLAQCFGVNPMYLLFNMQEQGEPFEVLPGLEVPQWEAYKWAVMRTNVINAYLGTSDFDEYRTAINMRETLERARRDATNLREEIASIKETGKPHLHRLNEAVPAIPLENRADVIQQLSARLESAEKEVQSARSVLEEIGVTFDETWFDAASVLEKYRNERWDKLSEATSVG